MTYIHCTLCGRYIDTFPDIVTRHHSSYTNGLYTQCYTTRQRYRTDDRTQS